MFKLGTVQGPHPLLGLVQGPHAPPLQRWKQFNLNTFLLKLKNMIQINNTIPEIEWMTVCVHALMYWTGSTSGCDVGG